MKKHPKLSLAIAVLVVIGAALVIAQTNRPAVTNGACCATLANPAMLASMRRDQRAGNPAGNETAAQTARSGRGQVHSLQNDGSQCWTS